VDGPAGGPPQKAAPEAAVLNAVELTRALGQDEKLKGRYQGKVVRIEGVVKEVNLKPDGRDPADAEVSLQGATDDPDKNKHIHVTCMLRDKPGAAKVGPGQKVVLQGAFITSFTALLLDGSVVSAGPVARTQVEIERLRKEQPKAVAALEKLGVSCRALGPGKPDYEVSLTDKHLTDDGHIKPEALAILAQFVDLSKLDLHDTRFSDAGLEGLKTLAHVETLDLSRTKVRGAGLAHLPGVPGLTWLKLSSPFNTEGLPITDAGLAHLKGMKGLRGLVLCKARVTDAGLAYLGGMPDLEVLDLAGNKITDAGLAHLAKAPQLWDLDLSGTSVGDAGLAHLTKVKTLRMLALSKNPKITADGLQKLKAALPELKVRFAP
jgi:hypothetical protein